MNYMTASTPLEQFTFWFRAQEPFTRLDIMSTLLGMMHPLELRFISTCMEELKEKDYVTFQECDDRYNTQDIGPEFMDLSNNLVRSKLLVALSLLHHNNYGNAGILYRILLSLTSMLDRLPRTKDVFDEVLLLLTMATHHPAFKFEHRAVIMELVSRVLIVRRVNGCEGYVQYYTHPPPGMPFATPGANNAQAASVGSRDHPNDQHRPAMTNGPNSSFGSDTKRTVDAVTQTDHSALRPKAKKPRVSSKKKKAASISSQLDNIDINSTSAPEPLALEVPNENQPAPAVAAIANDSESSPAEITEEEQQDQEFHVRNVTVLGARKADNGSAIFQLQVVWSDGKEEVVEKARHDFHHFHQQLLESLPIDSGLHGPSRKVPYLPDLDVMPTRNEDYRLQEHDVELYIKKVMALTNEKSNILAEFLRSNVSTDVPSHDVPDPVANSGIDLNPNTGTSHNTSFNRTDSNHDGNGMRSQQNLLDHLPAASSARETNGPSSGFSIASIPGHLSLSSVGVEPSLKSRLLPFSIHNTRPPAPTTVKQGNREGYNLATLIIVGPKSGANSIEKIMQSNMVPQENAAKMQRPESSGSGQQQW